MDLALAAAIMQAQDDAWQALSNASVTSYRAKLEREAAQREAEFQKRVQQLNLLAEYLQQYVSYKDLYPAKRKRICQISALASIIDSAMPKGFFIRLLYDTIKLNTVLTENKQVNEFQQLLKSEDPNHPYDTLANFFTFYADKKNNYPIKRQRICQIALLLDMLQQKHTAVNREFFNQVLYDTFKKKKVFVENKQVNEFQQLLKSEDPTHPYNSFARFFTFYADKKNNYPIKRQRICQLYILKNMLDYNTAAQSSIKQSIYTIMDKK